MSKKILIAIMGLTLTFTSNAFGQFHKDFPDAYRKNLKAVKSSKVKANENATTNARRARKPSSVGITNVNAPALKTKANSPKGFVGDLHQPLNQRNKEGLINASTGEVVWADIRSRTNPRTARGNRERKNKLKTAKSKVKKN